jgi:hypothetical protein
MQLDGFTSEAPDWRNGKLTAPHRTQLYVHCFS